MKFSPSSLAYWTEQDLKDLETTETAKEMHAIAERIIARMPRPIVQVCGPIASGGLGSLEANLNAFNEEIKKLQAQGLHVFDQMPFEMPMQKLKKDLKPGEYATSILDDFYLPILQSGEVKTFYLMQNWMTSKGAQWEHNLITKLGFEIKYL